jgi:hypothetical protein
MPVFWITADRIIGMDRALTSGVVARRIIRARRREKRNGRRVECVYHSSDDVSMAEGPVGIDVRKSVYACPMSRIRPAIAMVY